MNLRGTCYALVAAAVLAGWPTNAHAQMPRPNGGAAVEAVGGYTGFIDEDMVDHFVLGATLRYPVTSRLKIDGGVLYMNGPGPDRDWLFMPGVVVDLAKDGRIVPYVAGGVGWLRSTLPVGTGLYTSWEWTVAGGGGIRMNLGSRSYLAVEGRLGTEPLTRLTVAAGWRLGRLTTRPRP